MTMHTPWGAADYQEQVAPGITFYGTPSHGGFHLSADRLAQMPEYLRIASAWFEEDCDWALVVTAFPADFPEATQKQAYGCLRRWHPGPWKQHYSKTTTTEAA